MIDTVRRAGIAMTAPRGARRALAATAAVALIAVAAQVSVPLPATPVPWTLQPLAVLVVAGLLGRGLGTATVVAYLTVGALGLPVFAPGGAPGLLRFAGPTGGYLLAYPVAAVMTAAIVGDAPRFPRAALAAAFGLVVVHLGGLAQLVLLTGTWDAAARLGTLPFLLGDGVKVVIAGLLIARLTAPLRARL